MAVKKVEFKGLTATAFTYTAMGGIRFYDKSGVMIPAGAILSSALTSGESENFLINATSTYNSGYYYPMNAFDTAKKQIGGATESCYWASSNDNQTLTIEFKTSVLISKIEFVPLPDAGYTNRGIDTAFTINALDSAGGVKQSYSITPITQRATVQSLSTPELAKETKFLFQDGTDIKTYVKSGGTEAWDPNRRTDTGIVLSNSNLKADWPGTLGAWRLVKVSDTAKSTGKYYWEVTLNVTYQIPVVGIINEADTWGNAASVISYESGSLRNQGTVTASVFTAPATVGMVIAMALDMDNKTVQFYVNGKAEGPLVTGITSTSVLPFVASGGSSTTASFTANFGATSFKYQPPQGFGPYANIVKSWNLVGAAPATKAMFDSHGMAGLGIVDSAAIKGLVSTTPEILAWTNETGPLEYTDVLPTMTSNTAPSGVASASAALTGYEAWKAFNKTVTDEADCWVVQATSGWLEYKFDTATVVNKYTLRPQLNYPKGAPKDWVLKGSNDAITWVTLDTRTAQTGWSNTTHREFEFTNSTGYLHYRIEISSNDGHTYTTVSEMGMLKGTPTPAKRNTNLGAIPAPRVIFPTKDIDLSQVSSLSGVSVLGTQSGAGIIKMIVSNDSGLTWKTFVNNAWSAIDPSILSDVKTNGMTISAVNSISAADWSTIKTSVIRFGYYLEIDTTTDVAETDQLDLKIGVDGFMKKAAHGSEYSIEFTDTREMQVKVFANGNYKINYLV